MTHVQISTPPARADVDRIKALPDGGRGAIAVHGRANNRKAREQTRRALVQLGLDQRVALTLGWSTSMPEPLAEPRAEDTLVDAPIDDSDEP